MSNSPELMYIWNSPTNLPKLPYTYVTICHPSLEFVLPRGRGAYWWIEIETKAENENRNGVRTLREGDSFLALEEEYEYKDQINVRRYGSIFTGEGWKRVSMEVPKINADEEQYQFIYDFSK